MRDGAHLSPPSATHHGPKRKRRVGSNVRCAASVTRITEAPPHPTALRVGSGLELASNSMQRQAVAELRSAVPTLRIAREIASRL